MNNWSTGFPDQQDAASFLSASQVFIQLSQLYAVLQSYHPSWCQEHPLWSLVDALSDTGLCELVVNWQEWIEDLQMQPPTAAPMV